MINGVRYLKNLVEVHFDENVYTPFAFAVKNGEILCSVRGAHHQKTWFEIVPSETMGMIIRESINPSTDEIESLLQEIMAQRF